MILRFIRFQGTFLSYLLSYSTVYNYSLIQPIHLMARTKKFVYPRNSLYSVSRYNKFIQPRTTTLLIQPIQSMTRTKKFLYPRNSLYSVSRYIYLIQRIWGLNKRMLSRAIRVSCTGTGVQSFSFGTGTGLQSLHASV